MGAEAVVQSCMHVPCSPTETPSNTGAMPVQLLMTLELMVVTSCNCIGGEDLQSICTGHLEYHAYKEWSLTKLERVSFTAPS